MKIIDKIVIDNKAPKNKNVIWIDISRQTPIQRCYYGGQWKQLGSTSNTNTSQEVPGILEMYVPPVGTYSKENFEGQAGISSQQFLDATNGKYRAVKSLSNSVEQSTPTEPGMPTFIIDYDEGIPEHYYPILSTPNYSANTFYLGLVEFEGIRTIIYSPNSGYTVQFTPFEQ